MFRRLNSLESVVLPDYTMIGALSRYISDTRVSDFQPMGANFGILPPLENHIRDKKVRYEALAKRSMEYFGKEASKI